MNHLQSFKDYNRFNPLSIDSSSALFQYSPWWKRLQFRSKRVDSETVVQVGDGIDAVKDWTCTYLDVVPLNVNITVAWFTLSKMWLQIISLELNVSTWPYTNTVPFNSPVCYCTINNYPLGFKLCVICLYLDTIGILCCLRNLEMYPLKLVLYFGIMLQMVMMRVASMEGSCFCKNNALLCVGSVLC